MAFFLERFVSFLVAGRLAVVNLGQDFMREQVFFSDTPEIDQDQLAPQIFDSSNKNAFPWQEDPLL